MLPSNCGDRIEKRIQETSYDPHISIKRHKLIEYWRKRDQSVSFTKKKKKKKNFISIHYLFYGSMVKRPFHKNRKVL